MAIEGEIVDNKSGHTMSEMGLDVEMFRANRDFPFHFKELEPYSDDRGVFTIAKTSEPQSYGIGSYSGYNKFRRWLCEIVNGINQETFWELGKAGYDLDFGYLINFSDCDGVIGPDICKKIHQDFVKHKDLIKSSIWNLSSKRGKGGSTDDAFNFDYTYYTLEKAFEIGSRGIVIFM